MSWNELLEALEQGNLQDVEALMDLVIQKEQSDFEKHRRYSDDFEYNMMELIGTAINYDWIPILRRLYDHYKIDSHLMDQGSYKTNLHYAIYMAKRNSVLLLIEKNARLDSRTKHNESLLHCVVTKPQCVENLSTSFYTEERPAILNLLLQHMKIQRINIAEEINVQETKHGVTPLHTLATQMRILSRQMHLLDTQSSANLSSEEALKEEMKFNKDSAIILLQHGARLYLKDHAGRRAIDDMPEEIQNAVRPEYFKKLFKSEISIEDAKIFEGLIYHASFLTRILLFVSFTETNSTKNAKNHSNLKGILKGVVQLPLELHAEICKYLAGSYLNEPVEAKFLDKVFGHAHAREHRDLYKSFRTCGIS